MNFNYSDEQNALRDQLLRLVQKDYGFEQRKAFLKSAEGHSPAAWNNLAEMGVLALALPEAHGGLNGNAVDSLVVMECFGRGLVVEPYLSSVVLSASLVAQAGSTAQKDALLPKLAEGKLKLSLAHEESGSRYRESFVRTTAKSVGGGYALNGKKTVVLNGASADTLIISARSSGADADEKGISLFLVPRNAAGLSLHSYPTHDGQRAADLTLKDVKLGAEALLGKLDEGFAPLEHTLQRGIAAVCAEAVGGMDALLQITGAYLKTRKQFGVPIGSFQVLQHRMADMLMATEQARSMAYLAASKVDSTDAAERRRFLAAAKTLVGQAARQVGQQAVQLHGGIGVTDELNVSHYFKRLTLINAQFGDSDYHLGRYSDQLRAA